VIVRGRFIADAPYFAVHLRSAYFEGMVWLLADTGASCAALLDRDVGALRIPPKALVPAPVPLVGIGGSVRTFLVRDVELTFASDEGDVAIQQGISVIQHDLKRLPSEEASRILRLPSLLGRDVINRFHFTCDYGSGTVSLRR